MSEVTAKEVLLQATLEDLGRVVVAYSGGVDSTYLAAVAHETLGRDGCVAATAVSPSLARRELHEARALARRLGLNHLELPTHEVDREEYARNDADRCYWCKTELLEVLTPIAEAQGAAVALGTNLDDLGDHRPGTRAARERGAVAPLVDAGMSKQDVRTLSSARGLPTADKPAAPCLASRFAYGVRVTPRGLRRIDRAEEVVRSLGFEVFRVRDHGDLARIEVPADEIDRAAALKGELTQGLRELGFTYVTLDLSGFRSGSLNAVLDPPSIDRADQS